jgi:hypothetical protein
MTFVEISLEERNAAWSSLHVSLCEPGRVLPDNSCYYSVGVKSWGELDPILDMAVKYLLQLMSENTY